MSTTVHSSMLGLNTEAWLVPGFDAGNFTADGSMTWTVESGDVIELAYKVIGKTMILNFVIGGSTIGGTPAAFLKLKIPGGYTPKRGSYLPFLGINGANIVASVAGLTASSDQIKLFRAANGGTNWATGTNDSGVYGTLIFEVN